MITQARLKELLDYDPTTGVFVWKVSRGNRAARSTAGSKDAHGYICIEVYGRIYKAHRLAWLYVTGKWPEEQIDHTNCNRADNRVVNLREATNAENRANTMLCRSNTSGIKGVNWHKKAGKWRAYIGVGRRAIHLGLFYCREDAAAAYAEASARFHKDFGRTT